MNLEAIAYLSSATHGLGRAELVALLHKARERNREHGVTGALLYDDGSFLQYLEGEPPSLDIVYGAILRSPLHTGVIQLMRQAIAQREFSSWHMGFTRAERSQLLELASASWQQRLAEGTADAHRSRGMELLLQFWRASSREARGRL